jgi:hypothetical protein
MQEHWLSDAQLCQLGAIHDDFAFSGVCGFRCDEILSGRPYGGCAILWRSALAVSIEFVDSFSNRLCVVLISGET